MTQEVDQAQLDEIRYHLAQDEGIMVEILDSEGQAQPTVGRIVHYESAIGDVVYSPAIVVRTRRSTASRPDSLVAELPDDMTVDLLVHGLGKDYREYAVPYDPNRAPRTWRWPVRT